MPRVVVERGNEKGISLNLEAEQRPYVVGRSNQCNLVLTDFLVSRQHFRIEKANDLYTVEDLKSHNGTFVNGVRILAETMLCVGDIIRAGETLFSFLSDSERNEGALCGQKIGGYYLLTRIGVGGMGEVYKATQVALSRQVALKILAPELTADPTYVARFLSEARAAARLNHPNVISVHEVGEENGVYYLSMEFVGGGSVQDLISGPNKKMDPLRATEIVLEASRALEYAEKAGIVHRDIKPDNLMLTENGDVRLADLGIAKRLNTDGKADQAEGVFGSPHYMAPEQARGLPLDHRADLYSLGVTYYRMLSGKLPFTGKDAREIMEKQVFDAHEPLKKLEPKLAPLVYFVIDRLLRKRPAERYPTATALIKDLERALEQTRQGVTEQSEGSTRTTPGSSGRHRPSSKRNRQHGNGKGIFRRLMG
jgi:serine/threonine protein kinase